MKYFHKINLLVVLLLFNTLSFSQVFQYRGQIVNTTHSPVNSYFKDVVIGDIDNDGDLDVFLLQKHPTGNTEVNPTIDVLYRNNGNGISGSLTGNGGAFTLIPTSQAFTNPQDILTAKGYDGEIADMDGDGNMDLIRVDRGGMYQGTERPGTVHVMWGNGNGTFTSTVINANDPNDNIGCFINYDNVELADLDRDGDLDMIVAQLDECGCNLIIRNIGNRNFQIVNSGDTQTCALPAELTHTIDIGDLNGDLWPDVILGKNDAPNTGASDIEIYTGTNQAFVFESNVLSLDFSSNINQTTISEFADVNQDGFMDVVGGKDDQIVVYKHDGSPDLPGSSYNPYPATPVSTTIEAELLVYDSRVEDVNNNLQTDIMVIDHGDIVPGGGFDLHSVTALNYRDNGTPQLVNLKTEFVGNQEHGVITLALGDLDNDGDLDMITGGVGNTSGTYNRAAIHVYENVSDPVNIIMDQLDNVGVVVIHKDRELVQKALNKIEVDQYKIRKGAEVTFLAGNDIVLENGFEAVSGSQFTALLGTTLQNPSNTHGRSESQSSVLAESGIVKEVIEGTISFYPNPFSHEFTLKLIAKETTGVSLSIYDAGGREVMNPILDQLFNEGQHEIKIQFAELPDGLYFYQLKSGNDLYNGQLVKRQ